MFAGFRHGTSRIEAGPEAGPGSGLRLSDVRSGFSLRSPGASGQKSYQDGFTLIEVMAAFMVFSLLFGVILQILSTSVNNTRASGDYTRAALWAQSRLDAVGLEEMLEPGTTTGRFDEEFTWTQEVTEELIADERGLNPDELPISLYRVRLTVEWGDRRAVFETLRSVDTNWRDRQLDGQ